MKSIKHVSLRSRAAGITFALMLLGPVLSAVEPVALTKESSDAAAAKASSDQPIVQAELTKEEIKAALAQIDADLTQLAQVANVAPSSEQKAEIKARHTALKARRDELKKEFTRARYESFKAELQSEKDKVSAWTRDTFASKPVTNLALTATGATANQASEKIADYRSDANQLNKAEAKAALTHLDADIDLLDAKIDVVPNPARKTELKQGLKKLKERRSELNSEFRKARYDALVDDVKAEWTKTLNSP